jgi:hypothetical protein
VQVTEKPHLTPLVRASARLISQLVTGSFRGAMMCGGAFIPLNVDRDGPESAECAEGQPSKFAKNFVDRLMSDQGFDHRDLLKALSAHT